MAEKDTSAQRLKLLYLRDIFQKFTSETEALTRNQITDILLDYGITEGRKAFSEDVEALQKYGMDIRMTMGRTASYQLMTRDFELAELKLLADAVSSAKLLSESQSAALLKKLSTLCSDKEAAQIKRTVYVSGMVRQNSNKAVLYNVDTIQRAISSAPKKKISFRYFEYDMRKNKKYRDEARVCTPYALVWDNDHYYLVAWNDHRGTYSNFRVDRMEKVEIIDEPARRADPHFDLEDYILTHVSMFSGEESDVVLRCDKSLVNAVLDRFGMGVRIVPAKDGESFTVYAPVVAKEPFFGWVFQFGGKAEIIEPESIRSEYLAMLDKVLRGGAVVSITGYADRPGSLCELPGSALRRKSQALYIQHSVGYPVRNMEQRSDGAAHSMYDGDGSVVDTYPCLVCRNEHLFPGGFVFRLAVRRGEVRENPLQRGQRKGVGDGIRLPGGVALDSVGEGVHAGGGGH